MTQMTTTQTNNLTTSAAAIVNALTQYDRMLALPARFNDALVGFSATLDALAWEASGKAWVYDLEEVADGGLERLNELHDLGEGLQDAYLTNWNLAVDAATTQDEWQAMGNRIEAVAIQTLRRMASVERRILALAGARDSALPALVMARAMVHLG